MKLRPLIATMSLFSLLFAFAKGDPLQVGASAPTLSGVTDSGATLNLGDTYKKNNYTVVWFYPRALTGGCTKQGCSLRDASAELKKHGVAVVGVSTDSVEKQKEFKEKNTFDYPLIADTDHKVMQAFGQADANAAKREAYLVDKTGKIVYKDTGVTDKQAENILNFLATKKS
jgi:peroxiredoxin Q/BCP